MFTTAGGQTVSCVTDNNDGSISLRLLGPIVVDGDGKRRRETREVVLVEPTAREYAELRQMIVEVDKARNESWPYPPPPMMDGLDEAAARIAAIDYQRAIAEVNAVRRDYSVGADGTFPYALCVIEAAKRLGDATITVDDLPQEALEVRVCAALLEVWEAPLGGPVVPEGLKELLDGRAAALAPSSPEPQSPSSTAADSPDGEESSPPGTEPSTPSAPPTSTDSP